MTGVSKLTRVTRLTGVTRLTRQSIPVNGAKNAHCSETKFNPIVLQLTNEKFPEISEHDLRGNVFKCLENLKTFNCKWTIVFKVI